MQNDMVQKFITIQGKKIAYTCTGERNTKLIFFVHGLLSNSRDYDALINRLVEKGYKCVAIDLPGRGKSDWLTHKKHYRAKNYAQYCLGVIEEEFGTMPFDWFGVSLGGILGMSLCAMSEVNINRLILVDVGAQIPYKALNKISKYAKIKTTFGTRDQATHFLKTRCAQWGIKNQNTWDHLIAHNITHHHNSYHMHYDPQICKALPKWNLTIRLWFFWKKITQPVIIIRGERSTLLPEKVMLKMQKKYKGTDIKMITIPNCGHVPNLIEENQIEMLLPFFNYSTGTNSFAERSNA